MLKKLPLIAILAIGTLITSCSKDDDGTTDTSSNTGKNYLPITTGNNWTYNGSTSYTTTVGGTSVIGGETYHAMSNSTSTSQSYVRKSGSEYLIVDQQGYGTLTPQVLLKEAAAQGDVWNWTLSVTNSGYTTVNEYQFSIYDKLSSLTVNGVTYNDVLVIDLDLNTYFGGQLYYTLNDSRYYYANNIGMIKAEITGSTPVNLVSYSVN